MQYRAEIDGLRAVAVIPVILFHAGFTMFSGGFVGVDVFFVISGYLITHIILSELKQDSFSIIKFYERRARRILPALFVVMLVSIPLSLIWLAPSDLDSYFQSLTAVSLFSSNFLFWWESSYWDVASELKPLIHTWSLAVEEQYYVIFPLLMMAVWKINKQLIFACLLLITITSLSFAQWSSEIESEANFFLLPSRMWELAIGAMAAKVLIDKQLFGFNFKSIQPLNNALSVVGFLFIASAVILFDAETAHPSLITLFPTIGTALIILFAAPENFIGRLLGSHVLTKIGLISYSTYLWHQLFFSIARHQNSTEPSTLTFGFLIILTFLVAYLTYLYIETPFRNRNIFSRKKIFAYSLIGTLFFIAVGVTGHLNDDKIISSINPNYLERKAELKKLSRGRKNAVRATECHHINSGKLKNIDDFFQNWSCNGSAEKTLSDAKIGIFGDSHAADKAHSLQLAGIDFLHVGGTACSLLNPPRRCGRLLQFFHQKAAENGINIALIANRFNDKELKPAYLASLLNDWSSRYEYVYLFSPMVEFPYWRKNYLNTGELQFITDYTDSNLFYQSLKSIAVPQNVRIINTSELFCADVSNCSGLSPSGQILLSDSNHMSKFGAKYTGMKLKTLLSEWISEDLKKL